MPNGDRRMVGGGFGGFGQPGVRETKVVSGQTEIVIPRKQFLEVFVWSFTIMLLGYFCLKLLITTRGDWSLFIGIVTIVGVPILFIFFERKIAFQYFPRTYSDILEALYRIVHTDDVGRFILFAFFVSVVILLTVGFYIAFIVPQLVIILNEEAQFVFVFLAFLSLLIAFRPYYVFNKRQLEDSLRDSDSHYASEALKLEYEEKKRREEIIESLRSVGIAQDLPSANPEDVIVHPVMLKAPANPTAPQTAAQLKFKTAVFDFLDGIDSGLWGTNERSWRNELGQAKILANSHMRLLKIGPTIRDKLIEKKWAEWKDESDHSTGWVLLFSTDEIRRGGFNGGSEFKSATNGTPDEGSGETGVGAGEEDMED